MYTVKVGNFSFGIGSEERTGKRPLALIIIDGWGYSPRREGNAIALARTPNYDEICHRYPKTLLEASGTRVGLAHGSAGNSEVGHMTIGAGRIVRTGSSRVAQAIDSGEFYQNEILVSAMKAARERDSAVHLVGLLSDGGIHSNQNSLFALLKIAKTLGLENVFVHGILDGRDVPKRTADIYVEALELKLNDVGCGKIATLCGRFLAMDRDQNWERTARAYTLLVHGEGEPARDGITAIRNSFLRGIEDEFIQPIVMIDEDNNPVAKVEDGDVVIFFNHRGDRMRQLVQAISMNGAEEVAVLLKPNVDLVCLTEYDKTFKIPVAFRAEEERNLLAEVFAKNGVTNCRVSEFEKFAHITSFFNGGMAAEFPGEHRMLVTPRNGTDGLSYPEMSSFRITDKVRSGLDSGEHEVFIVNLAAADVMAHTGDLNRTIEAVQFIDTCIGGIVEKIREVEGIAIITSDHGNCEEMIDLSTGERSGTHTRNPVPFHFVDESANGLKLRTDGALEDIAPTILGVLGIETPAEMTGRDLRHITD